MRPFLVICSVVMCLLSPFAGGIIVWLIRQPITGTDLTSCCLAAWLGALSLFFALATCHFISERRSRARGAKVQWRKFRFQIPKEPPSNREWRKMKRRWQKGVEQAQRQAVDKEHCLIFYRQVMCGVFEELNPYVSEGVAEFPLSELLLRTEGTVMSFPKFLRKVGY